VIFSGCGVAFGGGEAGNDFFLSLDVTGEHVVDAPLTAAISYATIYSQPVDIVCELRQGKKTLREIGRKQAPGVPNLTPKDDGMPGNFSIDFSVDAAGSYKVECYTPADESNYIVEKFEIRKK
jgi:hypothetical protein